MHPQTGTQHIRTRVSSNNWIDCVERPLLKTNWRAHTTNRCRVHWRPVLDENHCRRSVRLGFAKARSMQWRVCTTKQTAVPLRRRSRRRRRRKGRRRRWRMRRSGIGSGDQWQNIKRKKQGGEDNNEQQRQKQLQQQQPQQQPHRDRRDTAHPGPRRAARPAFCRSRKAAGQSNTGRD